MNKNRIIWLDYARTLAIICVVLTHVTETVYSLSAENLIPYTIHRRLFVISMFTIGRLGVPIFFFLTGYLLLDREYSREKYIDFLKKNFCGLLLTTAIWIVIYNIFNLYFYGTSFDIGSCLQNLLFLRSTEMMHMWYMPVILGMYLFIPFVANALKNTDIRILCIPLSLVFAYYFVVPVINVWLLANGQEAVYALPDLSFSGNVYGFMILLGYMTKRGVFDKIPSLLLLVLGTLSLIFTVLTQNYSHMHGITYNVWYDSASLLITAISIFILMSRVHWRVGKIPESISKASFGIYLIHVLILIPMIKYYQSGISNVHRFAVVFVTVFGVAWLIVMLIEKLDFLSHILLFQKVRKL